MRETAINPGKTRRYAPSGLGFVRHGIGGTGYENAHVPGVRRCRAGRRSTTRKASLMNDLRREPGCHAGRGTAVAVGLAAVRAVARSIYFDREATHAGVQNALTAMIAGIGVGVSGNSATQWRSTAFLQR